MSGRHHTFPGDMVGVSAAGATTTGLGEDGAHPAILAVILSRNDAFEGLPTDGLTSGGGMGSSTCTGATC